MRHHQRLVRPLAAFIVVGGAAALESPIVGPRALGMGGANVAATDNTAAQFYNPAVFGFFGRDAPVVEAARPVEPAVESDPAADGAALGPTSDPAAGASSASPIEPAPTPARPTTPVPSPTAPLPNSEPVAPVSAVPAGAEPAAVASPQRDRDNNDVGRKNWGFTPIDLLVGVRSHGDAARSVQLAADVEFDDLASGLGGEDPIEGLVAVGTVVGNIDDPGTAIMAWANAGVAVRVGRVGVGVRTFAQASGRVESVDRDNLGLPAPPGQTFAQAVNATGSASDGDVILLTDPALLAALGGDTAALERLDFAARQQGISADDAAGLSETLILMSQQHGDDTLADNATSALVHGLSVSELPITYGHPFGDRLAVGGSIKLLVGRVYGGNERVFDNLADDEDDGVDLDEQYQQSITATIDLAVMVRLPMLNLGLTGRNLTAPRFDGPTADGIAFPAVRLDPQATFGVAFIPFRTVVLEVDCDLTRTRSLLPGYRSQVLSAGVEFDLLRFLALRAGGYRNIAESEPGPVVTAGIGLNVWAMRIDIAAAAALETITLEEGEDELPQEAQVSLGLAIDF
ncbi:MAG TPA: conjugal transfer protein TraF [Planctomycetota bacterium]|nr:conjugal transfer protein TraF [Planctomycetota bacterium]